MNFPDYQLASALLVMLTEEDPEIKALAEQECTERLVPGAEVNGHYKGRTMLSYAVQHKNTDLIERLLACGADITEPATDNLYSDYSVVAETTDPDMVRLLVRHGAPITDVDRHEMACAIGADLTPKHMMDADTVLRSCVVQRGDRNPTPCTNPFYLEQIRSCDSAYGGIKTLLAGKRDPYKLNPVFSFDRFGRTVTRLPDGRLVLIAGEHEDHYDPDFCIYNDVCVLDGEGGVEYFTYPVEDFPPTDFHTATLMEDHILIIGCLGYPKQRQEGVTQVLRLDLRTWRVTSVETTGDNPGWLSRHEAALVNDEIVVSGGKVEPGYRDLRGVHALDLRKMHWRKIS